MGKSNDILVNFFLAHPNAFAAEYALIGIKSVEWATGVQGQLREYLSEPFCFQLDTEMLSYFLQFAGAALETMRTVHRMASQEQF